MTTPNCREDPGDTGHPVTPRIRAWRRHHGCM